MTERIPLARTDIGTAEAAGVAGVDLCWLEKCDEVHIPEIIESLADSLCGF